MLIITQKHTRNLLGAVKCINKLFLAYIYTKTTNIRLLNHNAFIINHISSKIKQPNNNNQPLLNDTCYILYNIKYP